MKDFEKVYEEYIEKGRRKREVEEKIKETKQKHSEELKVLYKQLDELQNCKEIENLKEVLDYEGHGMAYSCLYLDKNIFRGQKINTLNYLKKQLEDKVGEELILVNYTSHFQKKDTEWDEYYSYDVKKTLIDTLFVPKSKLNKIYETFKKLNLENYKKVVKKIPNIFLLKREWFDGNYTEKIELNEDKFYCRLYFNLLKDFKEGIFEDDDFNKDIEYDKIILKTFKYYIKSEKLDKNLREEQELEEKIRENEKLKKQLLNKKELLKKSKIKLEEDEIIK